MKNNLFESGNFFVGCNYWASNAGTHMWQQWDESAVEADFARLAGDRVTTLRVFPMWSEFQPIKMHYAGGGAPREIRMGEMRLPDTEAGRAGVDETMAQRFSKLCDLAEKYGLRLVVGLVTGWMSGRLFVPELLYGKNVLTDPLAIKWEIKFVRYMVKRFKDHPAVVAWDLGNECNCLGGVESQEQAYVWAATIAMAIRCEDAVKPIVSGMHSLLPTGKWSMQDQGELTDVLCTHPYPLFTPHCDTDPMNRMKSALHAVAESTMYADIGGKPCFAEEAGVLGPMMISDEYAGDYVRAMMLSLMAHDCRGMMWWCANEQIELEHTPYEWCAVERELGLYYADHTPKPVVKSMKAFAEFVEQLPFETLPAAICDAVCVLTNGQDAWAAAYGAFILAKKAGLTLRFVFEEQELPEAEVYIVPSMAGFNAMLRHTQMELMRRVEQGATLYWSGNGMVVSPFEKATGLYVVTRAHAPYATTVELDGVTMRVEAENEVKLTATDAQVLATDGKGDIAFAVKKLGKGRVYTLNYAIEKLAATVPNATDGDETRKYETFYTHMPLRSAARAAACDNATIGLTEHVQDETHRILMAVNHEPFAQDAAIALAEGWQVVAVYSPQNGAKWENGVLALEHNNGAVLLIEKE